MPSHHPQEKGFFYISSCVDQRGVLLCMLVAKRDLHSTLPNFALLPFPASGSNQLIIAETHLLTKQ